MFDFETMCFNNKNGEMQKRLMEYFYDYMDIYVFRINGYHFFFDVFFFFLREIRKMGEVESLTGKIIDK